MRFLPAWEGITVSVIGLGYVGSCVAATLSENGIQTVGVDNDAGLIEELLAGHCRFREPGLPELLGRWVGTPRLRVTTDYAAVTATDIVIVAVGTPVRPDGTLLDTQLRSVCEELSRRIRPGQLLIFKSTVPVGTMRSLVAPLLESSGLRCGQDFGLAFCPERLSEGVALSELSRFPIVIGGWCQDSVDGAAVFWQKSIGVEVVSCGSLEAAELVKLTNNWWVDHNIALANELAKICAKVDVDVLEVIAAANSIPKGEASVNVLLPSVGVGGSCLTKDPWMLWRSGQELGVELQTIPVGRAVNDSMPAFTVDLIIEELGKLDKDLASATIAVLGVAFKNNTGDLRSTPVAPVVAALRKAGAQVRLFDPLAEAEETERVFGLRQSASLEEATRDADCVAVLAKHKQFDAVDFAGLRARTAQSCVIVDGRAYYSRDMIEALRELGFSYRGIGR
ncbi:nucleotide sugar dehydrogenase [Nonomuraea sp. SYSU D8015]|uniref:nucleotide sugar dehydrogenase n=1 Tax=Nonomuraea sp. SYSU D8015 TaxID=2593644 RepID=UPI0016601EC8|nr:nucleotide sugar dehydrogenase [Nonomuraea sp. SYSU D8015]